jgi:hypothetical protein
MHIWQNSMIRRYMIFGAIGMSALISVGLLLVIVILKQTPGNVENEDSRSPPIPGRRALLIGVTDYDHFPAYRLLGPGNDVITLRHILITFYGFLPDNVVCLAESEKSANRRPTRENIQREFQRLADVAKEGDQFFILLAGHGDRQPEMPPAKPEFRQADGISEIFLAADVRPAEGSPPPRFRTPSSMSIFVFG